VRRILTKLTGYAKRNNIVDIGLRYNPLYYNPIRRIIRDLEGMDAVERRALSERLLSRSLGWARATAGRRSLDQPFPDWPILEKEELRHRPEGFRRRTIIALPSKTSGSTGTPIKLWRSPRSIAAEQAFLDSLVEPFGLSFRHARIAILRTDNIKSPSDRTPPFGVTTNRGRFLILSSRHISTDTASWFAAALNDFAPDILWIYPNAAEALARRAIEQGLKVRVPVVLSSSEVLSESACRMLEQTFQARVISYYGQAERVAFAATTDQGRWFFNPAYGRIELRPVVGTSPSAELMHAEIIATGFWNESMPLVRYRVGDQVICPASYGQDDLEAVALGVKPFISVAGRETDYLVSPRGEILNGMDQLSWGVWNIIRMQVIQESRDFVRLNIIAAPTFDEADRKILNDNIALHLPDDMTVETCLVDELEASASGKIPYVMRRIEPSDARSAPGALSSDPGP
jgi:phenylacetate-CoA ligase